MGKVQKCAMETPKYPICRVCKVGEFNISQKLCDFSKSSKYIDLPKKMPEILLFLWILITTEN